jgi:uncharacterized protein
MVFRAVAEVVLLCLIIRYGGDDHQEILDKVENNGGKIIAPKTPHSDENGFSAIFPDSEGNKIGLNSPNQMT